MTDPCFRELSTDLMHFSAVKLFRFPCNLVTYTVSIFSVETTKSSRLINFAIFLISFLHSIASK
ncbi:hypothetical protein LEP1GSC199_1875 [Leptospira vanthielii serovar Holland str. Waz Holland = ATCC 700522]|uniref:Uncharacterized protein n=1 Tax=Leptospira vanthielii serovar Holland str. Waz Holland = ATCC 700522 TaxID=1218591 RepID=N1VXG1_9LEPT|nr:hypothetical protein LEP1GSC199_1875 [Leptospira vanthielii serovar Holland str. Waz Holland = ATCC 700522]